MNARASSIFTQAFAFQVPVLAVYVWYITAGLWTSMPRTFTTSLYDQLATGFREGHLYLDRVPAPDLLALPDPYAIQERKHVSSYIGDATLYQGRYYLYWGPVPAVLLLVAKATVYPGKIGDETLVFAFVSTLFIVTSTLLVDLYRRYFSDLPRWSVLGALPVLGLITPLTWVLNHPLIYEAALASAAMFLIAGIVFAYHAFGAGASRYLLMLSAGICWALAIGSQFTQVLPVTLALVICGLFIWSGSRASRAPSKMLLPMGMLCGPVALMLLGLAWYNLERFGSILEFGYRYQLAVVNLHEHYHEIFAPLYAVPNLYNYLLNPFHLDAAFPFLIPQYGRIFPGLPLDIPRIYYTEAITGLLLTSPLLVYALVPLVAKASALRGFLARWRSRGPGGDRLGWLTVILLGSAIVQVAVLLCFFYSAPRYLMPAAPTLTLLAVIGFWQSYRWLSTKPAARRWNAVGGVALGLYTVVVGSLLAVSSSQDRFIDGNPELLRRINALFFH